MRLIQKGNKTFVNVRYNYGQWLCV